MVFGGQYKYKLTSHTDNNKNIHIVRYTELRKEQYTRYTRRKQNEDPKTNKNIS